VDVLLNNRPFTKLRKSGKSGVLNNRSYTKLRKFGKSGGK